MEALTCVNDKEVVDAVVTALHSIGLSLLPVSSSTCPSSFVIMLQLADPKLAAWSDSECSTTVVSDDVDVADENTDEGTGSKYPSAGMLGHNTLGEEGGS